MGTLRALGVTMKKLQNLLFGALFAFAMIPGYAMTIRFNINHENPLTIDRSGDITEALKKDTMAIGKQAAASIASVGGASGIIFLRNILFYHAAERAGFWRGVPITGVRWLYECTVNAALCLGVGFGCLFAHSLLVEGCWFAKTFDKNSELTRSERAKAFCLCSFAALGMLTSAYVIKNIGYFTDPNRNYFLRHYCEARGLAFNW